MSPVTPSPLRRGAAVLLASTWCAAASAEPAPPSAPPEPAPAPVAQPVTEAPAPTPAPAAEQPMADAPQPGLPGGEPPVGDLPPDTAATAALFAQHGTGGAPSPSPSQNVTINLINRLVQRGVLTQGDAAELIQLAEADAAAAKAQAAAPAPPAANPDDVRVTYVPENVRNRIRDEIKEEVFRQARDEKWAAPNILPDWVEDVEPFADIRIRYEYYSLPEGNDNTGAFPNFNSINTGSPFDISGTQFSPQYNVDQDRQRVRLRARFGAEFDLEEGFSMGFRVGTGENSSPVTANQSFGASGGNFSKYALWLDRAFLKYEVGSDQNMSATVNLGRFDNPFFNTEAIWDDELGFDGLALNLRHALGKSVTPFLTVGAFPIFNTDFNFATNQPTKFESTDKWLYGAQAGLDWKITKDLNAKFAVGYFDFEGVEGELSDPYTPLSASDAGNTDGTRPSFAQKGNTYRPLRNIVPGPLNNYGTSAQYQYFGLASPFRNVTFTGRLDYNGYEPVQISLLGEYIKNTAFDRNAIKDVAVNNRGAVPSDGTFGVFDGDDTAWLLALKVGNAAMEKRGDWSTHFGYRYVGSDAVVDGFNDSDFGGGGTNVKGFTVGGSMALSKRVRMALRWMGADQIAGPPLKSDIIMFDITAKF